MSITFRDYLKKVGSGEHTSKPLTRLEAADAARQMLLAQATPAQIGAFLIAHRIKRPTPTELAGMLDAYDELGPRIPVLDPTQPLVIFGHPYDGRSRTSPVAPLVALLLADAGSRILLHGSGRCPTKYGVPLVDLWLSLGVDWRPLSLARVKESLEAVGLGFVYLPTHFPLAQTLMDYRDQIGKRPPLATLELIWTPYAGPIHLMAGYVHPPTEAMMLTAFQLRGLPMFTTVKGLEGSADLPRERTNILSLSHGSLPLERLLLKPRDYGMAGSELAFVDLPTWSHQAEQVLSGETNELSRAVVWNSGFYLWRCGHCPDMNSGIQLAEELLAQGKGRDQLTRLQHHLQQGG